MRQVSGGALRANSQKRLVSRDALKMEHFRDDCLQGCSQNEIRDLLRDATDCITNLQFVSWLACWHVIIYILRFQEDFIL